jgi:chorismate-pyruvate lyase
MNPVAFSDTAGAGAPLLLSSLPPFLRVLLVTDGTVTRTLEAYVGEPIEVCVLSHAAVRSERSYPVLGVPSGESILKRRVILKGQHTRTAYALAESVMIVDRLPHEIRYKLMEERQGIGELIRAGKLETYRELLGLRKAQADSWARELAIDKSASVVIRNYMICLGGQVAMEIEEVFPECVFNGG